VSELCAAFVEACEATDPEAYLMTLPDAELRELREMLADGDITSGVPALIDGLCTIVAARRWQEGGGQ
jgi:hypothetical protein